MTTHPAVALVNFPAPFKGPGLAHGQKSVSVILQGFTEAVAAKEYGPQFINYMNLLDHHINVKLPLTKENRLQLAQLLLSAVEDCHKNQRWDMALEARFFHSLTRIIKPQNEYYVDSHGQSESSLTGLVIDWKLVYSIVKHARNGNLSGFAQGGGNNSVSAAHRSHAPMLKGFIERARAYFAESATEEMLAEWATELSPQSSDYFWNLIMLQLFLPTNFPLEAKKWVPVLMPHFNDQRKDGNLYRIWFPLIARFTKVTIGIIDWTPYMPTIFNQYLLELRLPLSNLRNPIPSHSECPQPWDQYRTVELNAAMSTLVAYTIYEGSNTLPLLKQFITAISTFLHPTNAGAFSNKIGIFLTVASRYMQRLAEEKRLGDKRGYDAKFALQADDGFAKLITDVCVKGIFHKSPHISGYSGIALGDLANDFPDTVLPRVLEAIYAALESRTNSRNMMAAINVVVMLKNSLFNRKIYPQGATHVQNLMTMLLPAIQPLDMMKTVFASQFFIQLFANIPLIDCLDSEKAGKANSNTDELKLTPDMKATDDDARGVTLFFKEFSTDFVDQVLKFMAAQTKGMVNEQGVTAAPIGYNSRWVMMLNFFHNVSPEIYDQSLAQILAYIGKNCHVPASKEFGQLIKAMCNAAPEKGIPALVALVKKKLLNKAGTAVNAQVSNANVTWFLYLLGQALRLGGNADALGPHKDVVIQLYNLYKVNDSKEIRGSALKLLRYYLEGLTLVYPVDYKSFSKDVWNDENKGWKHWQMWGRAFEIERAAKRPELVGVERDDYDLKIQWHVPTAADLKTTEDVLATVLVPAVTALRANTGSLEDYAKIFDEVRNIARGAGGILGSETGNADTELKVVFPGVRPTDDMFPSLSFSKSSPVGALATAITTGDSVCLRQVLLQVVDESSTVVLAKDDVNLTESYLYVIAYLLARDGAVTLFKLMKNTRMDKQRRHQARNISYNRKCLARPALIRYYYIRYQKFNMARTHALPHTAVVSRLTASLSKCFLSDFTQIRQRARSLVVGLSRRSTKYGRIACKSTWDACLNVIRTDGSTEEALRGAVKNLDMTTLLNFRLDSRVPVSKLCEFLLTFVEHGEKHVHDKAQVAFNKLFQNLCAAIYPYAVDREEDITALLDTLDKLAVRLSPGELNKQHRRFQIVCVASILSLLGFVFGSPAVKAVCAKNNRPLVSDVVMLALRTGLTNEAVPFRRLAQVALSKILYAVNVNAGKPEDGNVVISAVDGQEQISGLVQTVFQVDPAATGPYAALPVKEITSESEYNNTQFLDDATSGVEGKTIQVTKSTANWTVPADFNASLVVSETELKALEAYFTANIDEIVSNLVDSHVNMSLETKQSHGGEQKGFGDVIVKKLCADVQILHSWKGAKIVEATEDRKSKQNFDRYTVLLVRALVTQFPALATGKDSVFVAALQKLVLEYQNSDDQRKGEKACTAVEIFTGIAHASYFLNFAERASVAAAVGPIVTQAMTKLQTDGKVFWSTGIHAALRNQDPRRNMWIIKAVLTGCLSSMDDLNTAGDSISPARYVLFFDMIFCVLLSLGWKGAVLGDKILTLCAVDSWVSTPYSQIRTASAALFKIVGKLCRLGKVEGPVVSSFVTKIAQQASATSLVSTETTATADGNNDEPMLESKSAAEDEAKALQERNIVDWTTLYCSLVLQSGDYSDFKAILPYYETMLAVKLPEEFARHQKYLRAAIPWILAPDEASVTEIITFIKNVSLNADWHVRLRAAQILKVFVARHSISMSNANARSIYKMCARLLVDSQLDVRIGASEALTSVFLMTCFLTESTQCAKMIRRFMKLAKTELIKTNKKRKSDPPAVKSQVDLDKVQQALSTRHGGILGLSALVTCFPYSIPEYLPEVLAFLAVRAFDPQPICGPLRKLFSKFTETHQDKWESEYMKLFTEDQLAKIQDVEVAPSYFG